MAIRSNKPIAVITGPYGYLGGLLRARLHGAGWETIALTRCPRNGDTAFSWSLGSRPPLSALSGATAVVHCAYDFSYRDSASVWRINVGGARTLLTDAARAGVPRILSLSSMSAYEGTSQLYGRAKLAIEEITHSVGGIAVRPGLVYGPDPGGMAGTLMRLTGLPLVPVFRGARQYPVHETDFAQRVVHILDSPTWTSETFGIAQPTPVSFRRLLAAIASLAGHTCRFVEIPWPPIYYLLRCAEFARLPLPLRSDSLLGLVHPAPKVRRSVQFPDLLDGLTRIDPGPSA